MFNLIVGFVEHLPNTPAIPVAGSAATREVAKWIAAGAIAGVALVAVPGVRAQHADLDADVALAGFHERVDAFAALHRRLLPPAAEVTGRDLISKLRTGDYLAAALRNARSEAQQGDIFTPEVASLFRRMLLDSIGEIDGERFLAELNGGETPPRGMHPTVNEPYSMLPLHRLPIHVQLGLPPIPAELDYRIAGHDLILWDLYAGIVVDFVPDAVTLPVATE